MRQDAGTAGVFVQGMRVSSTLTYSHPIQPWPQRLGKILALALPITTGMLSQSLLNLVDAALVGRLGEVALSGVGLGSYANFIFIALITGLSSAVQTLVARRRGQGDHARIGEPVNLALGVSLAFALPVSLLACALGPSILQLLTTDSQVAAVGAEYFHYRVLALTCVAINFSLRGYWNGIKDAVGFLRLLLLMHLLNVPLSYLLIFGGLGIPAFGAAGSGLGTLLAMALGSVLLLIQSYRRGARHGLLRVRPRLKTLTSLLNLALPGSAQQLVFAIGLMLLFWVIARLGAAEVALAHILINLGLLLILPGVGLGMAATTLVSHSLGEQQRETAYRWGIDTIWLALLVLFVLGLPLWIWPEAVLHLFIQDAELQALGRWPLIIQGLGLCLDAAAIVLTQALQGAGAHRTVMLINSASFWGLYLPLAWLFGVHLGWGLTAIWIVQMAQRLLNSLIFIGLWRQRRWQQISL